MARDLGVGEDEPRHAIGRGDRHGTRDRPAGVVAGEGEVLEPQGVGDADHLRSLMRRGRARERHHLRATEQAWPLTLTSLRAHAS